MHIRKTSRLSYLMSLLIAIICFTSINGYAEGQQDQHFYFVQITDTHFETGDNIARSEKAIELINALPMEIQFVVHTGDITTDLLDDEQLLDTALAIMGKVTAPVHYVPGNHDIFPEKLESTTTIFKENFGGLISRAEYNNVVFIFVFTEPLRKSFTIEGYQPFLQLQEYLEEANGKPVLIFHHAPSVTNFYGNQFRSGWEEEIRQKWVELINAYNVKAVITGHFHADQVHWLGDVPLFVSPPISGWWGRQTTFRIYEYNSGKLGYWTQYIR